MNKTLLLIICDFLLLNLLALTHWEKAEPQHPAPENAVPKAAASAPAINADMVELMRVSLEEEKTTRDQLAAKLAATQGSLTEREQNLASVQQQKGQLESSLAATQASTRELEQRYSAATQQAMLSKEQLAKMERELDERRAEADRQKAELDRLERQNTEARKRIENLNFAVGAAEKEKQVLTGNLADARQQIEVERTEREKVQAQTAQLTQGAGQLAVKSGELTQEIRENRPINPNVIFSEFLANRIQTRLSTRKAGLFSPTVKDKAAQTVLISDGNRVYALMHLSDTPFTLTETPADYNQVTAEVARDAATAPVTELQFLQIDPRVVVAPVDQAVAAHLGAKIYQLAKEPYKFAEAVLVRADDGRYGDIPFRIDQANPGFVKLDNRVVTRLFGEISPKRGDLVFSKTGDLIGIMVNSDYCAVLGNFAAAATLKTGDNPSPRTSVVLAELFRRWTQLPLNLQ